MRCVKWFAILLLSLCLTACSADADKTYRVREVIDGDTVEMSNGTRVRYIGVDTPETRVKIGGEWFFRPETLALEAKKLNEALVLGKAVTLEFDVVKKDKYGRILAYVYSGNQMVNEELIKRGLASVYTFPPNVKYSSEMAVLQKEAINEGRGIWGRIDDISPYDALDHIGNYVRVSGLVVDVNYARDKVYINFDRDYSSVLSVIIYKSNLLFFERQGINPFFLQGKRITIIGKVREQNGPRIILDNPSQLLVK